MLTLPRLLAAMLTVCIAISFQFPAPAAAQEEPSNNLVRNAWHEVGEMVEAGAEYATAVAAQARIAEYAEGRMACPLPTSTFIDSWGAPRSGGRSHQGVDMMAPHGIPVLAPATGTYRQHGYESFYLDAVDGTTYFGTHVAGHLHPDGPVNAGDPIAVNSNTGNASGGSPHLHLEIHTPEPINPYPATAAACAEPVATEVVAEVSVAAPEMEAVATRSVRRMGPAQAARFCRYATGGIGPRFIRCVHQAHGHEQGTRGHRFSDFRRQSRQLVRYLSATAIPYERNWDRVAACESGGNWSINTGNGYYGGVQFLPSTWRSVGGTGLPHRHSKAEQIKRAEILRQRAGLGQWPTCGRLWYG